jgi:hypothetical protein
MLQIVTLRAVTKAHDSSLRNCSTLALVSCRSVVAEPELFLPEGGG